MKTILVLFAGMLLSACAFRGYAEVRRLVSSGVVYLDDSKDKAAAWACMKGDTGGLECIDIATLAEELTVPPPAKGSTEL